MTVRHDLPPKGPPLGDKFRLHPFTKHLRMAQRNANILVDLLDRLESAHRGQIDATELYLACNAAATVHAFFPRDFHMGLHASALHADLRHALTQAEAFPEGLDIALTAPRAAARARRLASYLRDHGTMELACAFGRARTLYDNSPFLILFSGGISGVAAYFIGAMMITALTPWLSIGLAIAVSAGVATTAGTLISGVLRGEPALVSWPLIAVALRVIPPRHRAAYALEFRAELHELGLARQISYAVNVALHAPDLRRSLAEPRASDEGGEAVT